MNYPQPNSLYLCIDQGGHASRAMVFNQQGGMVAQAFRPVETQHKAEHVEYDPHHLLNSIQDAISEVLAQLGERQKYVRATGIATQRSNIVCWDMYSGQALSPIISWQDRRGAAQLKRLSGQANMIHDKTGLFLSPHYGASKLRWCLDNLSEVQRAAKEQRLRFGPMASYLVHHLVKERPCFTDPVNGARTQLLNLGSLDWDQSLLDLFELPRQFLPECVPNHHLYGQLQLAEHIPLNLVTGDQAAAMYAYGKIQPNTAYVNMGTGAFLSRPSGEMRIASRRLLTSLIRQKPGSSEFALEATVNGASAALEWFAETYDIPDLLTRLPRWLEESRHTALFLNAVAGLGAPFWVADFNSRFEGSDEPSARAAAVAESIIFLLQAGLEEMRKFASPPEQIQISGGLAHLDGLCQRLASLSGLPVYRPQDCEATARGLAFLLAANPPHWPEEDMGEWFEPQEDTALREAYSRWMDLMLEEMRKG